MGNLNCANNARQSSHPQILSTRTITETYYLDNVTGRTTQNRTETTQFYDVQLFKTDLMLTFYSAAKNMSDPVTSSEWLELVQAQCFDADVATQIFHNEILGRTAKERKLLSQRRSQTGFAPYLRQHNSFEYLPALDYPST